MYGLLLQSAADHLKSKYGEETWDRIRKEANISLNGFATHNIYSENIMVDMATAAAKITGDTLDTIMDSFGVEFVNFVGQFGYDRILKVLGRHMRDFLNGLDNLHEYLRFSYPKLKPPSFFVEDETKNGLTLTYRSRRRGFLHYVKGQIRQVGKVFYNTRVDIFMVANDYNEATQTTHVKFRLLFDNKAFREVANHIVDNIVDSIPLRPELLFELFPFHIVFSRKMEIRSVGPGLRAVLPMAVGKNLIDFFNLERPLTNFTWEDILHHTNNVFQLVGRKSFLRTAEQIEENVVNHDDVKGVVNNDEDHDQNQHSQDGTHHDGVNNSVLHLKGQMMYMHEWDCIMFLGTPIMSSLDDMFRVGLYINDLSMHDSSRDLVLAGTQQSAELKLALDQEQEKSRLLEQSMMKLDQEMQRTDALLYQMIPKPVADRLRKGVPSVDTCQVFDNVTILFSDVVGFTTICSQITPMEVVSMLNGMYTQFDQLSERHSVYKVETIGDAYMAVSGAPIVTKYHALHMCDMALDMRSSMNTLLNPSNNETMKIRIGAHTGTTVAGVVGLKMPRYCLFGDTVNTASRMETSGQAMKIHVSETTKKELEGYPYDLEERGSIEVKGKGKMKTYWLNGKKDVKGQDLSTCPFIAIMEEEVRSRNRDEKTDYNSSRLNMETSRLISSSPLPSYSPVSFKDISEDRASPGGRKISRSSADGEAMRLAAAMSQNGSQSDPPGCPFAMGLFGEPPAADSSQLSSDKQSPGTKKSQTQSPPKKTSNSLPSPVSTNSNSTTSKSPAVSTFQNVASTVNVLKHSTTVGSHANDSSNKSNKQTSSGDVVPPPSAASKPSGPKTLASFMSDPVKISYNGLRTSDLISGQINGKNTTGVPIRPTLPTSASIKDVPADTEKLENTAPQRSVSPVPDKSKDSDSIVAMNSRTTSTATIKSIKNKPDFTQHDIHTNEDSNIQEVNIPPENGSIGSKLSLEKRHFDIYNTDKQNNKDNVNHVIKTNFDCMSRAGLDNGTSNGKSKLCNVL